MKLFKREPKIIQVSEIRNSDDTIFDVSSLDILKTYCDIIYETKEAYFGCIRDGTFRLRKPNFKPDILKAKSLTLNTGSTMIYLDFETLVKISELYNANIWELAESYVIVGPGIYWLAEKQKER